MTAPDEEKVPEIMSAPPTYVEGLFDAEDAVIDEWQACAAGHYSGHHAALDSEDLAWHIRVYGDHRYAAALDDHESEVDALKAENDALQKVVEAFLRKYDECEPYINAAFVFQQIHGQAYDGPNYESELGQLRAALAALDEKEKP